MFGISTWRRWFAPQPHHELAGLAFVRLATAAILATHPLHALACPDDAAALAAQLADRGLPAASALAWTALVVQLVAALALLAPRGARLGALASIVVVGGGAALLYAPRWYVVGGDAVDGHPGVELNVLLLACLAAIAWAYPTRGGPAERHARAHRAMDVVRVASALSLLAHCYGPFVRRDVDGMRAWGEAMEQLGWSHGVALVWTIKTTELVGGVLRLSRRLVIPACLGHLAYLVPGLWLEHAPSWFVVGPQENGMEFSALLVVCTLATMFVHAPTRHAALHSA